MPNRVLHWASLLGRRLTVEIMPGLLRATRLNCVNHGLMLFLGELREDRQTHD